MFQLTKFVRSFDPKKTYVVVVGAGPAGLTGARMLSDLGVACTVLEADSQVGGISRTVEIDGWRFDIGGHRFFTKVDRVEEFWHRILPPEDFLLRPRMSRIFYKGTYFEYPLKAVNALRGLGILESIRCVGSYVWARLRPPKDQSTFEGWVAARFGWRLYRIFFKTYTEKVWGVPAVSIQADWAAQRIKNLSLFEAIKAAVLPSRNKRKITSLIEEFQYPKLGPGMMWERCAASLEQEGVQVQLKSEVAAIKRSSNGLIVTVSSGEQFICDAVLSSMPINNLVAILMPNAPDTVVTASKKLRHRDFLTVALVVPEEFSFPDNWIYIHAPEVRVGRVQNYGSWSPYMTKEGKTCLGLEYFVNVDDDLWLASDEHLISFATQELESLKLVEKSVVEQGFVVRMEKAYPVYDSEYSGALDVIKKWLENEWPEITPIGRNGMHRYNNQDHSMLTAMLAVENLVHNSQHDLWAVNVDSDYHEEASKTKTPGGTGRAAPLFR